VEFFIFLSVQGNIGKDKKDKKRSKGEDTKRVGGTNIGEMEK
jgi:hypothetical protein